jgi:hypothetical protein
MELDELKQSWQKATEKMELPNRDVLELIQHRSEGPVAQLKRRFRKGMILILLVTGFSLIELHGKSDLSEIMKWYLAGFCGMILIYFYLSYRLVSKMQEMQETVKANLQRQVHLLKTGLKWRLIVTRSMFVLYMVFLEAYMYLRPKDGLTQWRALPTGERLVIYAGIFLFMYLLTKYATTHRYKRHIEHLERLTEQMM